MFVLLFRPLETRQAGLQAGFRIDQELARDHHVLARKHTLLDFGPSIRNETGLDQARLEPGSQIEMNGYRLEYLTAKAIPEKHYGGAIARIRNRL